MCDEMIFGNVHIDISQWSGHDEYSDGPIEDELYTRLVGGEKEADIVLNETRYPILYHLSRERENILSWYPFKGTERVLEVGAGCGAVTSILCQKCRDVTAVELSLLRSKINAIRHANETNLHILVRNIMDYEEKHEYDIVTLIGVLEYANMFTGTNNAFVDFLKHIKGMLKPEGHLLIAIENRFGIKYFLGAREDHHWKLNEGLYGYPNQGAQTFSVEELLCLVATAGFSQNSMFSVWPDYKFPSQLKRIDQLEGPLYRDETMNYGEFVIQTASPRKVMNELFSAGIGNQMANSLFLDVSDNRTEMPSDVLMNTNRKEIFASSTIFYHNENVEKIPVGSKSRAMEMIESGANMISHRLGNTRVLIPKRKGVKLYFEWLPGQTLNNYLRNHDNETNEIWNRYIRQFDQLVYKGELTKKDRTLFGKFDFGTEILICPAPIDLNLDNIMVIDGEWTVFDTEWVFDEPVPLRYILWRSIFLFEEKNGIISQKLRNCLTINSDEQELFNGMEQRFNDYVYGATSPYQYVRRYLSDRKSVV